MHLINPFWATVAGGGGDAVTWNPADKLSSVILSNGNLSAVASISSLGGVRATVAHSTGKRYFEVLVVVVDAGNNCPYVGIQSASAPLDSKTGTSTGRGWAQQGSDAYVWDNGTFAGPYSAIANGDVIAFAVDFDSGKAWVAKNNVWRTGDPSAGTSPLWSDIAGTLYPAAFVSPNSPVTARFASSDWTYAPPTGFVQW
jgi:hypothetical protein